MNRIEMLKQMIAQQPDNPLFYYTLGKELLTAHQPVEATEALRRAVDLNPNYTAAYRELGRALTQAGNIEEAKGVYRKGIEVGEKTGDLQTVKEMQVFLRRLEKHQL